MSIICKGFTVQDAWYYLGTGNTAVPAVMKHGRDTAMPCPYED
ncbi:MAG: hypothetical protein WCD53_10975 [Microcoleus sp.]